MRNISKPSVRQRRRFLTWSLLGLSFVVPVVAILAIHALRKRVEQAHDAQVALAHILANANELEAKEYETIASEMLDADSSKQIERVRQETRFAIHELMRLHPADSQLQKIARDFETYTRNMREEFRLLAAGEVASAKAQDEAMVDPSFAELHQSIKDADPIFSTAADRTGYLADLGSAAVTLFTWLMMAFVFWLLSRSRRAVERAEMKRKLLHTSNEELRIEVDERKQAQEHLRELQRQQRALLDNISDMAWVKDKENRYVAVNEATSKAYGRKAEEIVGKTDFDMVPAKLAEGFQADDKQVMESGQRKRVEEPFVDAAGHRTWIETIKSPIVNDRGVVIGTAGTARDITERKKAEESLRASEERYRGLFESMREGFALCEIICDAAGKPCDFRYLEVNSAFEEIGLKRCDVIGKTARELFPQIEDYWIDNYGQVALTGAGMAFENYLQALDKHFKVTAFSPKPGQFAATFMDVTERKRADHVLEETNKRLNKALAELKTANERAVQQERLRALGTMASGVAHDFNNSLAAILGFSELLLNRPDYLADKDTARRYIEMMKVAAQDAGKVVDRLREFYRHRDEAEIFAPVDINRLANEAVALTQPKWKPEAEIKGILINVRTELQDVPPVAGNAANLREVLTNLIFNAVDAMPSGGTIAIRTRRDADRVVLEVADTGTGMTEEVRRRCLEPFFTTKGEHGTGLGLSMVYGIIQRHEGTIDIQSEIGKGTSFIISLPRGAAAPQVPEHKEPPAPRAGSLRVLVVDDDPMVRNIIGEYLKMDGHSVEIANSGRIGLEKFHGGGFDLVLVDRAMPDMSGDQVASVIKSVNPNLPIIMLTGFGSMMMAADEKPTSVDLIVGKPVTIEGLRAALAKVTAAAVSPESREVVGVS